MGKTAFALLAERKNNLWRNPAANLVAEEFCVRKKACARIVNDIIFLLVGA